MISLPGVRVPSEPMSYMIDAAYEAMRMDPSCAPFSKRILLKGWDAMLKVAPQMPDSRPMALAPRDGHAILAFGIHGNPVAAGTAHGVAPGDGWWAILLWGGAFKPDLGWVFAKDGSPAWSEPLCWAPLSVPRWSMFR